MPARAVNEVVSPDAELRKHVKGLCSCCQYILNDCSGIKKEYTIENGYMVTTVCDGFHSIDNQPDIVEQS